MEIDAWLCMVTPRKIFGIKLSNLKEFVDMESVPRSSQFDFSVDAIGHFSVPFQFDSKIYFGAGYEVITGGENGDFDIYTGNCKIYEFDIVEEEEDEHGMISAAAGKLTEASIPDSPRQLVGFYTASIKGDAYFLQASRGNMCILALRSGTRTWQPLSLACRQFCDDDRFWRKKSEYSFELDSFVFNNKIFTHFTPRSGPDHESFFCSLDPVEGKGEPGWKLEKYSMLECFHVNPDLFPCYPRITVTDPDLTDKNHIVTLSWAITCDENPNLSNVALIALLGNEERGVVDHQLLDECFGWIESSFSITSIRNRIFQLENGEVCAMLYGRLLKFKRRVLCISIFKLYKDSSMTGTAGEQKRILSVHVIGKSVYHLEDILVDAFALPSKKNKYIYIHKEGRR